MNEFDDLDDLDEVFGPLRSPAQPAELSRESATVDLMVNARHHSEEKHMFTSRSARIATLVAAGVLGFGGMAAASSPGFLGSGSLDESIVVQQAEEEQDDEEQVPEDSVPEDSVPEDSVPEDSVPEDSVVEEPAVERSVVEDEAGEEEPSILEDDLATAFNEEYCEDGNHGKTVSAVARGVFDFEAYNAANPDSPLTVKMAAQSSCGKMGDDLDDDDLDEIEDEIDDEDDTSQLEEPKAEKAEKSEAKAERPGKSDKGADKAAKGNGNGNGNGNGKSNGKRGG